MNSGLEPLETAAAGSICKGQTYEPVTREELVILACFLMAVLYVASGALVMAQWIVDDRAGRGPSGRRFPARMYPLPAWKREPSAPLQRTPGQLPGLVASSGTVRSESGKGRLQSNRTDRNKSRRGAAGSDKPDACGRGAYGTGHRDGRRGARKHHYFLSRGLVGEREVKDLPLNGRSFDTLIT